MSKTSKATDKVYETEISFLDNLRNWCGENNKTVLPKIGKSSAGFPVMIFLESGKENLRVVLSQKLGEKYPVGTKLDLRIFDDICIYDRGDMGLILSTGSVGLSPEDVYQETETILEETKQPIKELEPTPINF